MAVLGRLLVGSQQRVDLADFLSVQSYVASDFKELVKSFVGSRPIILKGFEIVDAPNAIGTNSVSIKVADSVLYDPTSAAGSFFSGLPEGNALSQPLVLGQELRPGTTNYIYLTLTTTGTAQDTRAFWDVDLNGGEGGEFNQTINTEAVLVVQAGVSTAGFPQGTIPVAKIGYSTSITDITDCRNLMFRLGTGGTSPDPNARFQFPALPSTQYARSEPSSTINSPSFPTPFFGGDKNIQTLKDWMDAVMTKLAELSGTTYWYETTSDLSLVNVYDDALGSSLKSKGTWQHSNSTVGQVTWTEDIVYRKMNDPREIIVRAGTKTLLNEQVMWIQMLRSKKINPLDTPVTFFNSSVYVNGPAVGLSIIAGGFSNLNLGDWVKAKGDPDYMYTRVVNFWTEASGGGSVTTNPSEAKSIQLEKNYTGLGGLENAVYTKGVYSGSEIQTTDRTDFNTYNAGGNLYWLANRSDTIQRVGGITILNYTSSVVDNADGKSAMVTFTGAHGLYNGDQIVISGGTVFDGTYVVEVYSSTKVTIQTTVTGTVTATVMWAVVTTIARTAGSTFQIESANHGFANGQNVAIAGVTGNTAVNGNYLINVRSSTQFQIPYSGSTSTAIVTNATATCAKVILKTDLGSVEVVQGESININEPDTKNLLGFIGMDSLAQTNPVYVVPSDVNNNMLAGASDYNSSATDSLTARVSRLTAMMADRVQDRGIKLIGKTTFRNTTSGSNQLITVAGDNLTVVKPGSSSQTATWSSPYPLAVNTALVVDIDRNGSGTLTPTVVAFDSNYLLQENRIVLLYRLSDSYVQTWDGNRIHPAASWTSNETEITQNKNIIVNEQVGTYYDGSKINFLTAIGYVYINIPGSNYYNRIDVSNFTSGISITDGQSAWVKINRRANKTFTNLQTSSSYEDSDAAGSVYVTASSSVPTNQDTIVLYSVQGTPGVLLRHHNADTSRSTIYEEYITVSGNHASPYLVTLPLDSRNGSVQAYYIKGAGQLEIFLNGQRQKVGEDYTENGTVNTAQSSVTFTRDYGLVDGDILCFRLASKGGIYTIDGGTTTTLQQAYNQGRTVTTIDGSPMTVSSSAGYKALQINGDLGVTGVIDPTGIAFTEQAANPLGSKDGLWIDTSGNLNQARPGKTPVSVNITQSITNPSTFLTAGNGIGISTATIFTNLDTNSGLEFNSAALRVMLPAAGPLARDATGIILNTDATSMQVTSSILGVKVDGSGAIVKGASGIGVNLETSNPTLQISSNQLGAKLDGSRAITTGTSGIGVNLNATNPGLAITANALDTKLDGSRAITSGASGLGVNLNATNPGLAITANALDAKLDAARAITSGASGLGVNLESSNPTLQISANQLGAKLDAAGAIVTGSAGLKIAVDGTSIKIQSNQLVVSGVPNLLSTFTNNSGSSIAAGSIVAGDTTTGQIALVSSNTLASATKFVGVAYATIANGTSGQVQTAGIATVSSSSLTVGKPVYFDPTTPGGVTSTRPTTYGTPIFMLGVATSSSTVAMQPQFIAVNTNIYREKYIQSGALATGGTVTLPVDSRAGGATRYYVVGQGYLSVYLNGQLLEPGGDDYSEVGSAGADSNQITITREDGLVDGDKLEFRIEAAQALARSLLSMT